MTTSFNRKTMPALLGLLIFFMGNQQGFAQPVTKINEAGQSPTTAVQRRLFRVLGGRSEPVRFKAITRLQASPNELDANLGIMIAGATKAIDEFSESVSQDAPPDQRDGALRPPPPSLALLIQVIGEQPTAAARTFILDLLDSRSDTIAMLACDAIGANEIDNAIDRLRLQTRRDAFTDHYGFRFSLVRALARLHHPDAIEFLERLGEQLEGQLRFEIEQRLANVDLRDFDGDERRLEQWLKEHPTEKELQQVIFEGDTFEFEPRPIAGIINDMIMPAEETPTNLAQKKDPSRVKLIAAASDSQRRPGLQRSQYYGINLDAQRLLFIIDRSGSMRAPAGYSTRLQQAKAELIQAVQGLSPSTEFSILFFDSQVHPWRDELIVATDENKRAAISFVNRITLGSNTNTHAAIERSLHFDTQLEAVFLLSDGKPTAGKTLLPNAIVADFVRENQFKNLKMHTIGIGVIGHTQWFLESLAKNSGGQFRRVK